MVQKVPLDAQPGPVVLFGSGETSPDGGKIFEWVTRHLPDSPSIALLETPAGFELNSAQVIGRVADFLRLRLQNAHPRVTVIPARRRGTPSSPDNPAVVAPLLQADLIFLGPGSPSYAVRQLQGSLAWQMLTARHRLGAALALASAAVAAVGAFALPVYEIYKVGEDLHWKAGLDFFGAYGLRLVFVPHWDNVDGGEELDTRRCFMGGSRFARLLEMLPPGVTVIGIDEKTALIVEPASGACRVMGKGGVTVLWTGGEQERTYRHGQRFPLADWGAVVNPDPVIGIPLEVWRQAVEARSRKQDQSCLHVPPPDKPPPEVQAMLEQREAARQRQDWPVADRLREQIAALGWEVRDTPEGTVVSKITGD